MVMEENRIEDEIMALRSEGASCSKATLLGIMRVMGSDYPEPLMEAIASGLRGGIGATRGEGTCGALTAAVVAAGIVCGPDEKRSLRIAKELYDSFKSERGAVECGALFAQGRMKCNECCICAGRKAVELLR